MGEARATGDPKAVVSADTGAGAGPRAGAGAGGGTAAAAAGTAAGAGAGTADTASTGAEEVRQPRLGGDGHAGASSVELAVECGVEEPEHSEERDWGACRPRRAMPPTQRYGGAAP